MTEQDWLVTTDPMPMIGLVRDTASDRRLRLLAVAACRRVWEMFEDARSRRGIDVAELFADGHVDEARLEDALTQASDAVNDSEGRSGGHQSVLAQMSFTKAVQSVTQPPSTCVSQTGRPVPYDGWASLAMIARAVAILRPEAAVERCPFPVGDLVWEDGSSEGFTEPLALDEQTAQTALIRDIFGNPFRPVTVDPAWLTSDVVALAEGIYQDRAFDRMPILADALQDAGCDNFDVLNHCLSEGPHVRGCHVLDLILGKS